MNTSEYRAEISNSFPNFQVETIDYLNEGMDSVALLVNGEYIFRFAKRKKSSGFGGGIPVEVTLLPLLEKKVDLAIPHFDWFAQTHEGLPYVGYKKIAGIPLSGGVLHSLDESTVYSIFKDISHFLSQMHLFPMEIAQKCGVQKRDFRHEYAKDRERVQTKVFPLLSEEQKKRIEDLLENYLHDEENFKYLPALLHADLWLEHIFFDTQQNKVTGIIDFGDMIIGDPDYDCMQIHEKYGDASLDLFEKYLPGFDKKRVKTKAVFFQTWNRVQDLLFYQDIGDDDGVINNLDSIKCNM